MSENKIVEPRTLPGFMELLPTEQIQFNKIKKVMDKKQFIECIKP